MSCEYDLFEKFPDGSSLWRSCILGRENAHLCLQEFARRSEHQFYAINLRTAKVIAFKLEQSARRFRPPARMERPRKEKTA